MDRLTASAIPRAALSAAQPDPAGSHLPRLPVAQHEAAHPPCSPLCPLKHAEGILFYPSSLCLFGLCFIPGPSPQPWPNTIPVLWTGCNPTGPALSMDTECGFIRALFRGNRRVWPPGPTRQGVPPSNVPPPALRVMWLPSVILGSGASGLPLQQWDAQRSSPRSSTHPQG